MAKLRRARKETEDDQVTPIDASLSWCRRQAWRFGPPLTISNGWVHMAVTPVTCDEGWACAWLDNAAGVRATDWPLGLSSTWKSARVAWKQGAMDRMWQGRRTSTPCFC